MSLRGLGTHEPRRQRKPESQSGDTAYTVDEEEEEEQSGSWAEHSQSQTRPSP